MTAIRSITVIVNGECLTGEAEPRMLLADFLRDELRRTGTHVGCEHGVCGACTIIIDGDAVRSCLMFAVQADGAEISTIEGLATNGEMHPLQKLFSEHHALQCGFCTPGMLMTAIDLVHNSNDHSPGAIRIGMSAALCRCTGYVGIIDAVMEYARQVHGDAAVTGDETGGGRNDG
jgi:carbon-monoxide dehydrogenase small subunit